MYTFVMTFHFELGSGATSFKNAYSQTRSICDVVCVCEPSCACRPRGLAVLPFCGIFLVIRKIVDFSMSHWGAETSIKNVDRLVRNRTMTNQLKSLLGTSLVRPGISEHSPGRSFLAWKSQGRAQLSKKSEKQIMIVDLNTRPGELSTHVLSRCL